MAQRGCIMAHRGCIMAHRACIMVHRPKTWKALERLPFWGTRVWNACPETWNACPKTWNAGPKTWNACPFGAPGRPEGAEFLARKSLKARKVAFGMDPALAIADPIYF